ncbi:BMP family lipoprotein [Pseudosporangium ferrugineum]|uniref:Nucleoside-binding protein n=1 Tax=Pseudosporangium ferrugineum TaxID=439699 RepID=A0A2T0SHR4_9ACTN|nr:BMP family ABC transporter substrate-binding protein [Pseudosporangium ferrugineum]PRY32952.1 nucleoside-binding protein [Pseudosporangium ferrugineum]
MRRRITAALLAAAVASLSACTAAPVTVSSDALTGLGSESVHVGIAYDSAGRGDKSFNDAAGAGLDRAKKELLVGATEVTTKSEDDEGRVAALRELVRAGSNPVIAVGFLYAGAIGTVAKENPGTLFAIIDDDSVQAKNVVSLLFSEEQGSYLVGVAAGLATESGRVGFVGGVDVPLIHKFEAGYTAGVHSVDPDIRVTARYLSKPPDFSGFGSPDKGRAAAAALLDGGADVVYSAAGGSGQGALEAVAAVPGAWAIGVDSDQYAGAAGAVKERILTSMLKRVDNGVFQEIQAFIKGDRAGGAKRYDLKVDGVGYATSNAAIEPYADGLERARYRILSGAVQVPSS